MGGLAGLVHFRGKAPDPAVVARMSARIAHRGPDGSGAWSDGPAALAHRQRKVVPTHSVQPLAASDLVLLFDGWIYDHEELNERAGGAPHDRGDAASLLQAWRKWGTDLARHVEGEYALAVWDRAARVLHLLRDRLGVRPLYWARRGGQVAFASELPALLEVPWIRPSLARKHLAEFLSFQVVHAPRTLLADVRQVEPGHWLRATRDGLRTRAWWTPQYAPVGTARPREGEIIDSLQEAVGEAVHRRVPRSTETGLYLSGGLGSTAIAAAARDRYLTLPSFTVAFDDDPHPELPFAGRVAGLLGLEHSEITVGSAELAAAFPDAVSALGHPTGNPAAILQLLLARAARTRVRVVLSGDGGEEIFGGRMLDGLGRALRSAERFARLPRAVRSGVRAALAPSGRGRRITSAPERYALELGIGGTNLFTADERSRLLRDHALVQPEVRQAVLAPFYADLDTDPINTALHGYLRSWLGEGSLPRADRTAAASGLDIRFPLLDRVVVHRAMALPGALKLRRVGGSLHTRWPLRAMLGGILPPPLVNRPKRGMPTPLGGWLAGPGRLFMEARFARLKEDPHELWRPSYLDELRSRIPRSRSASARMWSLILLDGWLEGLALARPAASADVR